MHLLLDYDMVYVLKYYKAKHGGSQIRSLSLY